MLLNRKTWWRGGDHGALLSITSSVRALLSWAALFGVNIASVHNDINSTLVSFAIIGNMNTFSLRSFLKLNKKE